MVYRTVDQLAAAAESLVDRDPDLFVLRQVGKSRLGHPLLLLSAGTGPENVLVVAGAHANEPIGGMTSLRLAERVARRHDTSWHFLLCADPDGARYNEGWLGTPASLVHYYRHFFRPAFAEQPEWLPAGGEPPLPETRTIVQLLDELRPVLQCSLHGSEVGGGWVQLTHDLPGVAAPLHRAAAELGIPLDPGPFDAFHWPSPAPGVYTMPPPGGIDQFRSLPDSTARSTWLYPFRYGTVSAVIEAPQWASEAATDPAPHPSPGKALREIGDTLRHDARLVAEQLDAARPHLERPEPMLPAVEEFLANAPGLARDWEPSVLLRETGPRLNTGRVAGLDVAARRLVMRSAAMLLRTLPAPGAGRAAAATAGVRGTLERLLRQWCDRLERDFAPRPVPVADQAEYQTRVALALLDRVH
ncbi:M14 family zinc carboxypeptidase [Streptomyces sp. URMC 129]|uniref:M14 family zinc carboxypeptidase n=1 Tax=Streptomyces sp. URMC 129 TaxID=3423407 RepID=UPI003F1E0BF3